MTGREPKVCASCGCRTYGASMRCCDNPVEEAASTYTDDIIQTMRDTITAQRETIAAQRRTIAELERTLAEGAESLGAAKAVLLAEQERRAERRAAWPKGTP